jgi:hypothetical protein
MGAQRRLAEYFRFLAESADDRTHPEAWAAFIEALPDENEHVLAIGRAQAKFGDPAVFTPISDKGLHLRTVAARPPSEHLLRYLASLEGRPEPWVYGDWAVQRPAPQRDGVPQWTVDIDVMVKGGDQHDWPPRFDHPDAKQSTYGRSDNVWPSYEQQHLTARLKLWADGEQDALALTQQLVGEHFARPGVIDHRVRAYLTPGEWEDKPRSPQELTGGAYPVRWQRAEVDGARLTIAWAERGESLHRVTVDERPDQVIITVWKRFGPIWTEDGMRKGIARPGTRGVRVGTAKLQLERPPDDRVLVDGATGRAPDDLSIWQYAEKETRARVLAATLPI